MTATQLPDGLQTIVPPQFTDNRGYFFEAYNKARFRAQTGFEGEFVQDSQSLSRRGVVRGLHYQAEPRAQGKLVRVIRGRVFDVAVDIRRGSESCGQWFGIELSAVDRNQLWIPVGFAHGFLVLSELAEILYKTTDGHSPEHERTIRWDDPTIGIHWPLDRVDEVVLSERDESGVALVDAGLLS